MSEMTMVERVARAICIAAGHDPDGPTCDIFVPGDPYAHLPWAGFRRQARAAIEALRTPTPEMVEAGDLAMVGLKSAKPEYSTFPLGWQAAIDAALNTARAGEHAVRDV